ncbi:hypothetical protein BD779DRAFT_1677130 [Infundibulicybe gibba]|nr:hypothetical protein BD779DRAFT_1677130 [Infundibulicybe gibba]
MADHSITTDSALLAMMDFAELRESIATAHEALQCLSAFQLSAVSVRGTGEQLQQTDELRLTDVPAPAADGSLASDGAVNWTVSGASVPEQAEQLSGNTADPPEDRWYAVTVGRDPGVVHGVHNLIPNTTGIPGTAAQRYSSEETAATAYHEVLMAGLVVRVQLTITRCTLGIISDDESESNGQD